MKFPLKKILNIIFDLLGFAKDHGWIYDAKRDIYVNEKTGEESKEKPY